MRQRTTLLALFFALAASASFSYSACPATAALNPASLKCAACPANQIANTYQAIPTACQCALGYAPSGNGACAAMGASCSATANTFYPLYSLSGAVTAVSSCGSCAANAYTNR